MGCPELIIMLTHDDCTVNNAYALFDACKDLPVRYWGIKEKGLPEADMKALYDAVRRHGKVGVLEVVAYTEEECLAGARLAAECGCAILMGTMYHDTVHAVCREHGIRYMPFVGDVCSRPSVLHGTVEAIAAEAVKCEEKGVFGIDLLGYRYDGDAILLAETTVHAVHTPVCLAGSINSYERLDEVLRVSPAFFTVGSALFDHAFGDDFAEQVRNIYEYIHKK